MDPQRKIPTRLNRDPIIEAICEIRFDGTTKSVGSLLVGLLYSQLREEFPKHDKLATADVPEVIREMTPQTKYAPQHRLTGKGRVVSVGDHSLSVAVQSPYIGWPEFRPLIARVFQAANDTNLLGSLTRVSVRYLNLLDVPEDRTLADVVRVQIQLGNDPVQDRSPIQLKREQTEGHVNILLQLGFPATVQTPGRADLHGLAVDVDIVSKAGLPDFQDGLLATIDDLHEREKRVFFGLLTEATEDSYEPQY